MDVRYDVGYSVGWGDTMIPVGRHLALRWRVFSTVGLHHDCRGSMFRTVGGYYDYSEWIP